MRAYLRPLAGMRFDHPSRSATQRSPRLTAEIGDVANRVVSKTDTVQLRSGFNQPGGRLQYMTLKADPA